MKNIIAKAIENHQQALLLLQKETTVIEKIAAVCIASLKTGGKIIFMGNGGSAADAQHLAAELVGRFKKNRGGLASIALNCNTSALTAIGNDFSFEEVFSRQIEALGKKGDVVIGISTSGKSVNVINAIKKATALKLTTIGFLGKDGGEIKKLVDISLNIATNNTPSIQEMHILAGHIICEIIEEKISL